MNHYCKTGVYLPDQLKGRERERIEDSLNEVVWDVMHLSAFSYCHVTDWVLFPISLISRDTVFSQPLLHMVLLQ